MDKKKSLVNLREGECARVTYLISNGAMRRRLQDIGLVEGTLVQCVQKNFSGDPTAYAIRGAIIALRSEDARDVYVS